MLGTGAKGAQAPHTTVQPRGLAGAGLEQVRGEPVLKALLFSTEPLEPVWITGSKGTLEPVLMTRFALVSQHPRNRLVWQHFWYYEICLGVVQTPKFREVGANLFIC